MICYLKLALAIQFWLGYREIEGYSMLLEIVVLVEVPSPDCIAYYLIILYLIEIANCRPAKYLRISEIFTTVMTYRNATTFHAPGASADPAEDG